MIWWLCTWAVLASDASALNSAFIFGFHNSFSSAVDCVKASAGLGALVWLLFLVTLVFFGMCRVSPFPLSSFHHAQCKSHCKNSQRLTGALSPLAAQPPQGRGWRGPCRGACHGPNDQHQRHRRG